MFNLWGKNGGLSIGGTIIVRAVAIAALIPTCADFLLNKTKGVVEGITSIRLQVLTARRSSQGKDQI